MGKTTLIIDGDILSFRCAAANETRSILTTHKGTGQTTKYAHRTSFRECIKGLFEEDEFEIEDVQECEDIKNAYHAINTSVNAWMKSCSAEEVEVYISGKSNFRDRLPLPSKYKGTRSSIKPLQLKECRDYLVTKYKAISAVDEEADDCLSKRAYEGFKEGTKNIVISADKDSYGVESWLYNWTKMSEPMLIKGLGEVELDEKRVLRGFGRKWFYAQWVLGDKVDEFKPCELANKKFGDVSCFKLLADCKSDKECVEAVYNQYKTWYPVPITYLSWDGVEHTKTDIKLMDMYAACAHMRRWDGDVFSTEKLLTNLGINYGN